MPQEFLRDVLRTGDAPARARRRLSVLPVSIAVHGVAVAVFVMSPFGAGIDLPAISSPLHARPFMPAVLPTPPPPPSQPTVTPRADPGAPTEAPSTIAPEHPATPSVGVEGGLPPGPGVDVGTPVLGDANTNVLPVAPPAPPPAAPTKPIPIGGNIREPKKVVHVAPEYPVMAQRARVQGTVILEATLDVAGNVDRLRVLRSEPLLDEAALRAVRQWRYTPTLLNGVPVSVLMTITVRFTLSQ